MDALAAIEAQRPVDSVQTPAAFDAAPVTTEPVAPTVDPQRSDATELSDEAADALVHDDDPENADAARTLPFVQARAVAPRTPAQTGEAQRRASVQQSMASGQPVWFQNEQGQRSGMMVTPVASARAGFASFQVRVEGQEIGIHVEAGVDAPTAVARVVNLWSQYPEDLRDLLGNVLVDRAPGVRVGSGRKLAESGDDLIEFHDGVKNITKRVFDHEMGHVVGDLTEDRQASPAERAQEQAAGQEIESVDDQWIPEGYAQAVRADRSGVSRYGNTAVCEDWAEFWRVFMDARSRGGNALANVQRQFPARFRIADAIYRGQDYAR